MQPIPTRMLYRHKAGGDVLHGVPVETVIVSEDETQDKVMEGWSLTPTDAAELHRVNAEVPVPADPVSTDDAAPTREELERKATELGIGFNARTKDETLAEKIAAALKG